MRKLILVILISFFITTTAYSQTSVKEDAEDGDTAGWSVYDSIPEGATITNVYDNAKQSRVIKFYAPGGSQNGFRYVWIKDYENFGVQWDMKYWEAGTGSAYYVYIRTHLTSGEHVYMTYSPYRDLDRSIYNSTGYSYIFYRLDNITRNGQWHTIIRNLEQDLHAVDGVAPGFEGFKDKQIAYIDAFLMRGNYMVDNIILNNVKISVPHFMRFQGKLQDATGALLNGAFTLTFRLYEEETGGAPLWSETQQSINIVDGLLDVELGSVTPIDLPFDKQYWLGVEVESDGEMIPRFKLATVPYSFISER